MPRRIEYNDQFHQVMRERQRKYDAEIKAILDENDWRWTKTNIKEAMRIRKERKQKEE